MNTFAEGGNVWSPYDSKAKKVTSPKPNLSERLSTPRGMVWANLITGGIAIMASVMTWMASNSHYELRKDYFVLSPVFHGSGIDVLPGQLIVASIFYVAAVLTIYGVIALFSNTTKRMEIAVIGAVVLFTAPFSLFVTVTRGTSDAVINWVEEEVGSSLKWESLTISDGAYNSFTTPDGEHVNITFHQNGEKLTFTTE